MPGETIAGYRVEEQIGRGGMGEVYLAHDERLGRPVALKLLAAHVSDDDGFRERMLRESRLAASLDHPNVIPIYEAGEDGGRLFIAMRYVEGLDLKALLRREGALDPARTIAIAAQVADALDAAHRRDLVHRDVKPSNVLLDHAGGREHVYLADFGLTQSATDDRPTEGHLMGTVDYVAPEQIRGDPIDGRADVYALGCLLFECLTGRLPYAGKSEVATIYAHLEEEPPRASDRAPDLAPAVDEVLQRAIAKLPERRQETCAQLVEETRLALGLRATVPSLRLRAALVTAALALSGVAVFVALDRSSGSVAGSGGTIVRIDPRRDAVVATYPVSSHPRAVAAGAGRVWAGDFRDGSLWRLDPATGDVQRFTTTGEPRDISVLGGKVYVASDGDTVTDGSVTRYDAVTGTREAGVQVLSCSIATGDGVVWTAGCPFIDRLSTDAGRLRVVKQALIPFQQPESAETHRFSIRDMAVGEGALWVLGDPVDRRVFRVDLRTGRITRITDLPFAPRSIAAGEGGVWVTGPIDDVVGRLDPRSGKLTATIPVPSGASGVAAGLGAVWVASALDGSVSRIDPASGHVVTTIPVRGAPREIAVGAGSVWVTADES
jgi:YVTN family beta-propeller protein